MDVGQGFSKPIIRGLGFNRVAVAENGIKQEGQQWGADHGLEIDQFGVEQIEIIKGPSSLAFGSDAIGGVIQILPIQIPQKKTLIISLQTIYKSINNQKGGSFMTKYRHNDWHFYFRFTRFTFSDYKVPTDSFFYNRYRFPIINKTLKNTAGKEQDFYLTVGIVKNQYKSNITLSNVFSKIGFFPGSHGIPSASKLLDDGNNKNIDLPYQKVNHLKIMNNTKFFFQNSTFEINIGFQNNFRQEWSLFHTHYQNQTAPDVNPDLELEFQLNTISAELKYKYLFEKHNIETGVSSQNQINDIAGYMFLLPKFSKTTVGTYIYDKFLPNKKLVIDAGIRFDYGIINISEYYSIYTQRNKSEEFKKNFYDISWGVGLSYLINNDLNFKTNIGKSFRMPNASELSANGVHHGSFRYEVGDSIINSEYSYQYDLGLYYENKLFLCELNAFVNYFPNFIYLSPTGSYLHPDGYEILEADAGQIYQYIQSKAFRSGGEIMLTYNPFEQLTILASAEYVYATDLSYPIPFTPPLNIYSSISYTFIKVGKSFGDTKFEINANFTSSQNRVARNELKTKGYSIFNFNFSTNISIFKKTINFAFQIYNIFNTKYFNHLSFYRLIELPEPGRNFQLSLKIPIEQTFSNE
jgi:iron complex outermembrane receptor protein